VIIKTKLKAERYVYYQYKIELTDKTEHIVAFYNVY